MDNIFSSVGSGIIAIDSNDLVHTFKPCGRRDP